MMKLLMRTLVILSILTLSSVFFSQPALEVVVSSQRGATTTQTAPNNLACKREKPKANYGQFAGLIRYADGQCYRQVGDARPVLLNPKRDQAAKVFVGETFQCFAGSMMFELTGSTAGQGSTYTIRADDGCQTIKAPSIPRKDGNGPALETHGTLRAGPTRGDSSPFCSPANKSWIAPEKLVFRWTPAAVGSVLSLTVLGAESTLWYADDVKGTPGELVNDDVRSRLLAFRDKGGLNPLLLVVEDSKGQKYNIQFSLLSKLEEDTLGSELDNCAKRGGDILLSLCRVSAFRNRKMYREVAEEYEKALQLAPESKELIAKTAEANQAVGGATCPHQ